MTYHDAAIVKVESVVKRYPKIVETGTDKANPGYCFPGLSAVLVASAFLTFRSYSIVRRWKFMRLL